MRFYNTGALTNVSMIPTWFHIILPDIFPCLLFKFKLKKNQHLWNFIVAYFCEPIFVVVFVIDLTNINNKSTSTFNFSLYNTITFKKMINSHS